MDIDPTRPLLLKDDGDARSVFSSYFTQDASEFSFLHEPALLCLRSENIAELLFERLGKETGAHPFIVKDPIVPFLFKNRIALIDVPDNINENDMKRNADNIMSFLWKNLTLAAKSFGGSRKGPLAKVVRQIRDEQIQLKRTGRSSVKVMRFVDMRDSRSDTRRAEIILTTFVVMLSTPLDRMHELPILSTTSGRVLVSFGDCEEFHKDMRRARAPEESDSSFQTAFDESVRSDNDFDEFEDMETIEQDYQFDMD